MCEIGKYVDIFLLMFNKLNMKYDVEFVFILYI